jgi:hypothetical protein
MSQTRTIAPTKQEIADKLYEAADSQRGITRKALMRKAAMGELVEHETDYGRRWLLDEREILRWNDAEQRFVLPKLTI